MKKNGNPLSNEFIFLLLSIFLGIILFLLDSLGILSFARSGISFIMDPVAFQANSIGSAGRDYLQTFVRLNDFRKEFNDLSTYVYEKDVENSFYLLLKEENESLRKQISLGSENKKYVMSKVLSGTDYNFLNINKGESSDIVVGDVVVFGNMLVGIVVRVDREGSLVRLATNKNNSLEAVVVRGGVEEARLSEGVDILTKAIVKGSSDGIKVENMSMNVDLQEGDIVVVNDSKVGEYLVLGRLVALSDNPAATSRSGYVSPIIEYDRLITVFVRVEL